MKALIRTSVIAKCFLLAAVVLLVSGCENGEPEFSITPNSAVVDAATRTSLQLVVSGGVPPYVWSSANRELGTLAAAGNTAIYSSRPLAGENVVSVTDADGRTVSVMIEHM